MTTDSLITLHRYYIWANKLRVDFQDILKNKNKISKAQYEVESLMYMSLWYGTLYVVIEGWQNLKLKDQVIDSLLKSKYTNLLKRYRNGVFHFQKKYKDKRFDDLDKEKDAVKWIINLNKEFGRFFMEKLKV